MLKVRAMCAVRAVRAMYRIGLGADRVSFRVRKRVRVSSGLNDCAQCRPAGHTGSWPAGPHCAHYL